jgi:hypothetical protein
MPVSQGSAVPRRLSGPEAETMRSLDALVAVDARFNRPEGA